MITRLLNPLFAKVASFFAAALLLSGCSGEEKTSEPIITRSTQESYPSRILIIRHAEKTIEKPVPDLNAEGKERAESLFKLFERSDHRPTPFARPDFIFAGKDTKKSYRPVQTVTPLAKKLNLAINSEYGNEEMDNLASELFQNPLYRDKTVLISWRHGSIPQLATKLKASGVPQKWEDNVYDRVWLITYDKSGAATFSDQPQELMPKDSHKSGHP